MKRINKMDVMRNMIKELGSNASAKEMINLAKSKYKVDFKPQMAYDYRRTVLKKEKEPAMAKSKTKPSAVAAPAVEEKAVTPSPSGSDKKTAVTLGDVATVRDLINRYGPDETKVLVTLFS